MMEQEDKYQFTQEEWSTCIKVLQSLKNNPFENPDNEQFGGLITSIYKKAKKESRKVSYQEKRKADLNNIHSTKVSKIALENQSRFSVEEKETNHYTSLEIPKNCYCCNTSYQHLHFFYSRLCPSCAEENYANRFRTVDLTNRNVILTGGRVKIGYAAALKFLRSNAHLTLTTRFPAIAMKQFEQEEDFEKWKDRLNIYGLDLRNLNAIETFIEYYKSKFKALDILINNAAQTIKYPEDYYLPLIQEEKKLLSQGTLCIPNQTPIAQNEMLKLDQDGFKLELNRFGQPLDSRIKNSWNSTLEEIGMEELLEVNLINQISPYILIKALTPLMKNSVYEEKFIINVTSSEGQFSYSNKSIFHPHTNMTKASLNMLTRTSGKEYQKYGIYMNAVDVGWVSTGAKEELRKKQFSKGYIPPLDPVDGASRILMPIIDEIEKNKSCGTFGRLLKNYKIEEW